MGQFSNAPSAIDTLHTVPHRALDYRPGLVGLKQFDGPNSPTPSIRSICGKFNNIFIRCTNRKLYDISNEGNI